MQINTNDKSCVWCAIRSWSVCVSSDDASIRWFVMAFK